MTRPEIVQELKRVRLKIDELIKQNEAFEISQNSQTAVRIIQREVAEEFGLTVDNITSERRFSEWVFARSVAMKFVRQLTNLNLTKTGALFGRKDHGTVWHAINRVNELMAIEPETCKKVKNLETRIKSILGEK